MRVYARFLAPLALLGAGVVATPAAAERPVTDFTSQEVIDWAKISPDGTKMVADMEIEGERRLTIFPLNGQGESLPLQMGEGEVHYVEWVGNDWIVLMVGRDGYWRNYETYITRLVALKVDGSEQHELSPPKGMTPEGYHPYGGTVRWVAKDGSPNILVEFTPNPFDTTPEGRFPRVAKVDIAKDKWTFVTPAMEGVRNWYADTTGAVRVGAGREKGGVSRLVYREDGESGLFKEVNSVGRVEQLPVPRLFLRDDKALVVSRHEGYSAVYEMDLTTMQTGAKVFGAPGYDVSGILTDPVNPNGLRGITYEDSRSRVQWFDPRFNAAQDVIDATFGPGNARIASSSYDANQHIIKVNRGESPGYYFYDVAAKRIAPIAKPTSDQRWAPTRAVKYKARDGLEIEAFLTLPRDKEAKNLPVLIMPHGGPRVRDYEGWDLWAQFFADRGYLVIQPNYRGSTGYGFEFERAGVGEWGLKMQDDLDDALAWAVSEGLADGSRACMIGGSYGGYAAMRAAQRNPDLYRCAISFAGASDLQDMMTTDQGDFVDVTDITEYWKEQTKDLKAVSPVNYPEQFGTPILLVHGKEDKRVPVRHSRRMAEALRKAGKPYVYIEQEENDHHFTRDEDMHQFLLEAEKFLDQHNPA
ncbi:alpha/beta hydrolase family protein [Paraurantiacibacter namhicola]|uniref:Esterase n=1 Tax=Paraurantiacibacter namhicola TaxID=645517 RepID=A0A1C7D515_9SPHN|nr:alpha/beta fold hydrolase [Paraurantiacibacter namhicola]ANU06539.1 esterase [Paraurantiacibacter namhicola]